MEDAIMTGSGDIIEETIKKVVSSWRKKIDENSASVSFISKSKYIDEMETNLTTELARILSRKKAIGLLPEKIVIVENIKGKSHLTGDELILVNVDLSHGIFDSFNFDGKILVNVSADYSKFNNCRFRKTHFLFCDLRYAEVNGGTFEGSYLWWCDLYRAYFQGVVRFANSVIVNSSLNNTYFAAGVLIRKLNLKDHSILQENENAYRRFLVLWDSMRLSHDKIKSDDNKNGDQKIDDIVQKRFGEMELIFKNFSSSFSANGFSNDSNWAYVMGKKAEREVLISKFSCQELFGIRWSSQLKIAGKMCANWLYDKAFGYGESLGKIIRTYLIIVLFFTFIYMYKADICSFLQAMFISFKNMVGISSPELEGRQDIILNLLNTIQTTVGILITGIFGFILGNKIRNQ